MYWINLYPVDELDQLGTRHGNRRTILAREFDAKSQAVESFFPPWNFGHLSRETVIKTVYVNGKCPIAWRVGES